MLQNWIKIAFTNYKRNWTSHDDQSFGIDYRLYCFYSGISELAGREKAMKTGYLAGRIFIW